MSEKGYLTRAMGGADSEWGRRNNLTPALAFSHNLAEVFPPALYAERPEFFPLVAGARLRPGAGPVNWNPDLGRADVAAHAAAKAGEYFTANPAAVSFALGVNDGLVFGESAETLELISGNAKASAASAASTANYAGKWFRGRPDFSPLVFTFMNRVAVDLTQVHPQKYVGALAYYWAENAPPFAVDPHVIPFLTADRAQGYDAAFLAEERRLQRRWIAVLAPPRPVSASRRTNAPAVRLGLYDYLEGYGFLVPRVHVRLLADNLRRARGLGFTDYYAEGLGNWGLDGPQPWVVAQLLQDPTQPLEPLLTEYYERYFGPAAEPMRRFFERCERQWMRQEGPAYWLKYYRDEAQTQLFPSAVCRELRGLLEEAIRRSGGAGQPERYAQRVALVSAAFRVTEAFVDMCEQRTALDRAVLGGQRTKEEIAAGMERFSTARTTFLAAVETIQREQPLALARINRVDWDHHSPLTTARMAIGEIDGSSPGWRELARNGNLAGPIVPARTIAGLQYGIALPADWGSRVEPVERHRASLRADGTGSTRILRLTGAKDASVLQWSRVQPGAFHLAQVQMRGRVGIGAAATLTFGWMDENLQNLGFTTARLPEGIWAEFVTLSEGATPPANAAWVGVGVRIQHQTDDDWIEARAFSLKVR